jgi:hypothetical protein
MSLPPTNDKTLWILVEMDKSREGSRKGRSYTLTMTGQGLLLVYKENRIIAEKFFYDVLPSKVEVWTRDEANNWVLALCAQELLSSTQSILEPSVPASASGIPIDLSLAKPSTSTAINFELSPITWPSFEELCKTPPPMPLLQDPSSKKKRIRKRKAGSSGNQPEWMAAVVNPSEGTTLLQPKK